ncbi:MAG: hypothetical protein EZS28_032882, partial [Streblomastix strix]
MNIGTPVSEAFRIGQELADKVTQMNPPPVKLMMEKTKSNYKRPGSLPSAAAVSASTPWWMTAKGDRIGYVIIKPQFAIIGKTVAQQQKSKNALNIGDGLRLNEMMMKMKKQKEELNQQSNTLLKTSSSSSSFTQVALTTASQSKIKLADRAVPPRYIVEDPYSLIIDSNYYINKMILPPLSRIFILLGVNNIISTLGRKTKVRPGSSFRNGSISTRLSFLPIDTAVSSLNAYSSTTLFYNAINLIRSNPVFRSY